MPTTKEAKDAKIESGGKQASHEFTPELQESLIEQAEAASEEHRRIEMDRLKEDLDTRHALLTTLEPKEREHVAQALKGCSAVVHAASALPLRPFPPQLAYPVPIDAIDYQIMRPPFTPYFFQPPSRQTQACYNVPNDTLSDLLLVSRECVPELGALSLECAIGVVNHNSCGSGKLGCSGGGRIPRRPS